MSLRSNRPCKVVRSDREVIERTLLARLDDEATVAILASREDLDLFIRGMEALPGDEAAERFARDMQQLRTEAFGPTT